MQSFLITAKDKNKASSYISNFLKEKEIESIDISLQIYEKAMGIEDVRNIQKKILLKPFRGKTKAVVAQAYESITQEAQNALLKVLEEPPVNTIIIISTKKKELLLPTIISRCKIIELKEDYLTLSRSSEENAQYLNMLISLPENEVGERLKLAQDITKNKGDAEMWLEKMINLARQQLLETQSKKPSTLASQFSTSQYLNVLVSLQKTYTIIKTTNVNQRLALENLFLNL
mgnify:FL=1